MVFLLWLLSDVILCTTPTFSAFPERFFKLVFVSVVSLYTDHLASCYMYINGWRNAMRLCACHEG